MRKYKSPFSGKTEYLYEVGDQVMIVRKDIFHLKDVKGKQRWGTIVHIDGGYIYVRPAYKRWEIELYDCEIKPRFKHLAKLLNAN